MTGNTLASIIMMIFHSWGFNTSCVSVGLIRRSIQPVNLWHPHSSSAHPKRGKTLAVKQRISFRQEGALSLSAVFINWRQTQYTLGSWIKRTFPSFHSATNRMFVCSHDARFPSSMVVLNPYLTNVKIWVIYLCTQSTLLYFSILISVFFYKPSKDYI